ncbi:CpsD/CapB family tyrosine-protein kinase [Puniceibacterium sediminis]|uniref:Chromosome partitioning ATPase, Mrp family, contains Fe-S cluster n=1 Tax=Puniceibacterium sediminis TaxID=1608407 RepID=A0A238YN19_9RHOB|nr:CpsD/CapB family tyrosine-protein kinase [Puniceibacterium sediminis]SNR71829.1 Chromosome partitioning ATPase, Mrp family, contains Fe-S cluster [Puniceibacterium sediminis]
MDKIQSAIAKARAERSGTPPHIGQTARSGVGTAPDPSADVKAAWQALPTLMLNERQMERRRIVAFQGGSPASAVDMLRTRVLQQMRANNWRRLAITSPSANCGKSTVSLNLAFSLARQPDLRTVLIELDLRRPTLGSMLGVSRDISFAGVLDGSRRFEDNALRHGDNLAISTNRGPSRNPAELLNGPHVAEVLSDIEARYDPTLMIFDTPPMLAADDTMAFAGQVDCVLLVAAAEATTIKEIDMCERELAGQTNVMGVILNKCRYMGQEYGSGYYD